MWRRRGFLGGLFFLRREWFCEFQFKWGRWRRFRQWFFAVIEFGFQFVRFEFLQFELIEFQLFQFQLVEFQFIEFQFQLRFGFQFRVWSFERFRFGWLRRVWRLGRFWWRFRRIGWWRIRRFWRWRVGRRQFQRWRVRGRRRFWGWWFGRRLSGAAA